MKDGVRQALFIKGDWTEGMIQIVEQYPSGIDLENEILNHMLFEVMSAVREVGGLKYVRNIEFEDVE